VLFVSREYPPETGGGGIGSYVETMARALVRQGHEVHVLSCVPGQAIDDRVHEGVQLHRRGVYRLLPKIRRRIPSTALRIEGAISCYLEFVRLGVDVDVVEAPDWMAEGWAFALLGSRPLVAHLHTPLFLVGRTNPGSFRWTRDGRTADRVERLAVRRADLLTSPSELLVGDLARARWIRHREARIVRYPIDLEAWESVSPVGASPPRVLAVGRLEARKAPEVLVRAAAALAPEIPGLEMVFVGRPGLRNGRSYKEWLIDLVAELDAPCRFVDEVPRHELGSWYGGSRVVAIASRYDNFPYAGVEAMAAARPVVCTSATGTAEIITGTDAGAVVAVDDVGAIATALRPYLVDAAAAERAGRQAYSVVSQHCSPEKIAEQREDCYRAAIEHWRRRPRGRLRGSR
jgi:glycogen synthase